MFTYPGKKLMFMGGELGDWDEWSHERELQWGLLDYPDHRGVQRLVGDLAHLYRESPALCRGDFDAQGFEWIDCHDNRQSVLTYLRRAGDRVAVVVLNFTPLPRLGYRIGVPKPGEYQEVLNSDSRHYGGSGVGNLGRCSTEAVPWMGRAQSLTLTVPPLGALVLEHV
jgi:1,4-alpha-glucan branching enzyme